MQYFSKFSFLFAGIIEEHEANLNANRKQLFISLLAMLMLAILKYIVMYINVARLICSQNVF